MDNYLALSTVQLPRSTFPGTSYAAVVSFGFVENGGFSFQFGDTCHVAQDPDKVLCFKCNELGHKAPDCPREKCETCRTYTHTEDEECPRKDDPVKSTAVCRNCGEEGHMKVSWPNPVSDRNMTCRKCGERGHRRANCTWAGRCRHCHFDKHPGQPCASLCKHCEATDHIAERCKQPPKEGWQKVVVDVTNASSSTDVDMGNTSEALPSNFKAAAPSSADIKMSSARLVDELAMRQKLEAQSMLRNVLSSSDIRATLKFVKHEHASYISITLTLPWTVESLPEKIRNVEIDMELRLSPRAIVELPQLSTTTTSEESPAHLDEALKIQFPRSTEVQRAQWIREPVMHRLSLRTNANSVAGFNFFNHLQYPQRHHEVIEELRRCLLAHDCHITLLITTETNIIEEELAAFRDAYLKHLTSNAINGWWRADYDSDPDFLSLGKEIEPSARPQYETELPALNVFDSDIEYVTVFAYRAFTGLEAAKEETKEERVIFRLVEMVCGNNNVFLGTFSNIRAKEDDFAKLSFDVSQSSEDWWHVQFAPKHPAVPACDTTAYLSRPFNKDTKEYEGTVIPDNRIVKLALDQSTEELAEAIINCTPTKAILHRMVPQRQFKRVINFLRFLYRNRDKLRMIFKLIKGTHLRDMPVYNLFEKDISRLGMKRILAIQTYLQVGLGTDQRKALASLKRMYAYLTIVNGMGGTGKTHVVVIICAYMYLTGNENMPGGVHVVSNTNDTIDDLAQKIYNFLLTTYENLLGTELEAHYPIAIRRHAHEADKELSRKEAESERNKGKVTSSAMAEPSDETLAHLQLSILSIHLVTYQNYMLKKKARESGVRDRRLKVQHLSLGTTVLALAGYPDANGQTHPRALDASEHHVVNTFRLFTNRYKRSEKLSDDEMEKWSLAYNSLAQLAMEMADVIVEPPQMYLEQRNHVGYSPRLVVVDEAAKVPEIEVVAAMAYAAKISDDKETEYCPVLMVGDTQQPKPIMHAVKLEEGLQEPFRHQDALSLFTRLIACGLTPINFRHQFRFVPEIAHLLEGIGYYGITTDKSVEELHGAKLAKNVWKSAFGAEKRIYAIVDSHSTQIADSASSSLANPRHCDLAFWTVALLQSKGIPANKVAIVTPYNFELGTLTSLQQVGIEHYHKNADKLPGWADDLKDLTLTTADNLQGGQAEYVVFIIPNTEKLGFLNETARIIMALSRARFGIIIITNYTALVNSNNGYPNFLNSAYNVMMRMLTQRGLVLHVNEIQNDALRKQYRLPFKAGSMHERARYQRVGQDAMPLNQVLVEPVDHRGIFGDAMEVDAGNGAGGNGEIDNGDSGQKGDPGNAWAQSTGAQNGGDAGGDAKGAGQGGGDWNAGTAALPEGNW